MRYGTGPVGQGKVDEKCRCPKVRINRFTTEYSWDEHQWITHSFRYQQKYEAALGGAANCCQLLTEMLALMLATDELVQRAHDDGDIDGGRDEDHEFDLIRYRDPKKESMVLNYFELLNQA